MQLKRTVLTRLCGYSREGKLVPVVKHRSMNTVWGMDLFIHLFVCLWFGNDFSCSSEYLVSNGRLSNKLERM